MDLSYLKKTTGSWFRWFVSQTLHCGPLPKHIAIIMDGNRRWSKKNNSQVQSGHSSGFDTLYDCLEWCLELGIEKVTVYAFSIENFKRSESEVQFLFKLALQKVALLLKEQELVNKYGICVRVLGDLQLLPQDVQDAFHDITEKSKSNTKAILNVCVSYTARNEMYHSVKSLCHQVDEGDLSPNEILISDFEKELYEKDEVDILIRTSGESRLSDFMLWQTSFSCIVFFSVLWPDFSFWHLFWALILYQRNHSKLIERRELSQGLSQGGGVQ